MSLSMNTLGTTNLRCKLEASESMWFILRPKLKYIVIAFLDQILIFAICTTQ